MKTLAQGSDERGVGPSTRIQGPVHAPGAARALVPERGHRQVACPTDRRTRRSATNLAKWLERFERADRHRTRVRALYPQRPGRHLLEGRGPSIVHGSWRHLHRLTVWQAQGAKDLMPMPRLRTGRSTPASGPQQAGLPNSLTFSPAPQHVCAQTRQYQAQGHAPGQLIWPDLAEI